ncbi:molecular chaperone HtpG [Gemmiger sp. An120]|uniref:molecular chaperone HtpG n=1 Tax=Gemmiger TaxID=204475 RepID=UPI000B396111|nr:MULTISPECIES: molecular chaperone HtpG [Gemmiger]MBM6915028.1 molecular chaperone HtpG [Gemmiger formicilis]OUQ43985.1 molecular chaperone HtpG [Gemmiger sp. An120]
MAMKQFKAESKKLLDLMINSIYTNKDIFLRELISNASDAIDKLYFRSLTDNSVKLTKDDFQILLTVNKADRTLTITDNGIGMTKEELEKNLGTIARSGSLDFKAENHAEDIDIIGQFGVGFYSAFMVASRVTVISKAFGSDEAWMWESKGAEGYTLTQTEKAEAGTQIILVIKENTEQDQYDQYLDEYTLVDIVKKYSDYVRYPIRMYREKTRAKEKPADAGDDYKPEYETYTELETLNSMVPLWRRNKSEVTEEEYNRFYKEKFFDYTDPARVITSRTEGTATYNALLFIPGRAPFDYYTREYEKGLQLYASGVLIMDKCPDLLPDHFSFVKGIVDSQDLSLNISREMLQKDSQLKLIRNSLEKKIKNELNAFKNNDREKYEEFFKNFGRQLKFGCYADYGMHSELLKDLLLFFSAKQQKMVTLDEYVEAMPEDQKCIYFAAGESADRLAKLPAAELVLEKGYDLLLLTEDVDEFCLQVLRNYKEKEFKNVNSGDLGLESEEEKKAAEEASAESKELFEAMQKALGDKVKAVKVSTRLKNHPVCLSSEGPLSIEMEKVLRQQPGAEGVKSDKVLELNAQHPVFAVLKAAQESGDTEKLEKYTKLLFDQALLIEGLPIEDPVAYAQAVCELMK